MNSVLSKLVKKIKDDAEKESLIQPEPKIAQGGGVEQVKSKPECAQQQRDIGLAIKYPNEQQQRFMFHAESNPGHGPRFDSLSVEDYLGIQSNSGILADEEKNEEETMLQLN